nr:Mn superoxide dismutase [Dugesia japonica]
MLKTKILSNLFVSSNRVYVIPSCFKHTLPDLPYDYNALEPSISADIMEVHHKKHHAAYVNNLNIALEQLDEAVHKNDVSKVISMQNAIKFNGGGHLNHSIFWKNLCPKGGGEPDGSLLAALQREFGSFENFKIELSAAAVGIQGSGWAWLGLNKKNGRLHITTCGNQDPLEASTGLKPLLGFDVWEHAYYLQYKNVRPDYVKALWRIINWNDVAHRFSEGVEGTHK